MATQAVKDAFESQNVNYELKFFIQDNNYNWVDFTDRAQWRGKNQLRKIGSLTYSTERLRGQLQQRISSVTFDNPDNYWDKPLPASLRASFDQDWNTVSALASFSTSSGGKESIVFRHKAAVRINCILTMSNVPVSSLLGVFLIEDLSTNSEDSSATFTFAPMSTPLIDADASTVREGKHWYQNSPSNLLIERILQKVYADQNGALPTSWQIDDISNVRTPVSGPDGWSFSHLGRPPERTVSYNGLTTTWMKDTRVCEAMAAWEYKPSGNGSITVTAGSATIVGNGTGWSSSTANLQEKINVGDALIIRRQYVSGDGGSQYENDGYYYVVSVDDTTHITLNKYPPGTEDESGLKYTIVRLYMGIGQDLYEYNITTDTYRKLSETPVYAANTGKYRITRIWNNTADTEYPIRFIITSSEPKFHNVYLNLCDGIYTFRFRWNGSTPECEYTGALYSEDSPYYPLLCDGFYRESEKRFTTPERWWVGRDDDYRIRQSSISIPFEQNVHIFKVVDTVGAITFGVTDNRAWDATADIGTAIGELNTSNEIYLYPSQYAASTDAVPVPDADIPFILQYTAGQVGFLELNPYTGDKGEIVFCCVDFPGYDTDADANTMDTWRRVYYYTCNLSTGAVAAISTLNNDTTVRTYLPTAVTFDPDGKMYIALHREKQWNSVTQDARVYCVSADRASKVAVNASSTSSDDYCFTDLYYTTDSSSNPMLYATRTNMHLITVDAPTNAFDLVHFPDLTGTGWGIAPTVKAAADNPLVGMRRINVGTDAVPLYKIAFFESGDGKLKYTTNSATAGAVTKMTVVGFQSTDLYCLNRPVWLDNVLEFWYISSPLARYYHIAQSTGKYWLTKWSSCYSTRIEMADFDGLNAWTSLSMIADVCNAIYGFNVDGSFFFKEKPRHHGTSYTFTNDGGNHLLLHAEKGRGQAEIVNKATFIPGTTKFGDTEFNFQVTPKSNYGKDAGHIIEVYTGDTYPRQITLVCTKGGKIKQTLGDSNNRAEFKYRIVDKNVETVLASNYDGGNIVLLQTQEGIIYGATVNITTVVNDADSTASDYVGIQMKNVGSVIVIDGDITATDYWIPLRRYSGGSWDLSDTYPLDDLDANIQISDIILLGSNADHTTWEYIQVAEIDVDNSRIGVSRGVVDDLPSIAHNDGSMMSIIRNTYYGEVYLQNGTGSTADKGDTVSVEMPYADADSLSFFQTIWDDTSGNAPAYKYMPVENEYTYIGEERGPFRTGVMLRFSVPSGESDNAAVFSVGDIIHVKCPGLILDQDQAQQQTYEDLSSKRRWGLRESQSNGNKFMSIDQARWAVRREVEDNKEPHYLMEIQTAYIPWIDPLDIIAIQSRDLFPKSVQFTERFSISPMTFNPQERPTMSLTLRGIDSY